MPSARRSPASDARRLPREVVVQLFRRQPREPLLMLRRVPERGGFWQGVSGAPLPGETDADAAAREVREETGFDVTGSLFSLGIEYRHGLDPARADQWRELFGPGVRSVSVTAFAAEIPDRAPVLDPAEHDRYAWCSFAAARELLDWPIEADARARRRAVLDRLRDRQDLFAGAE